MKINWKIIDLENLLKSNDKLYFFLYQNKCFEIYKMNLRDVALFLKVEVQRKG